MAPGLRIRVWLLPAKLEASTDAAGGWRGQGVDWGSVEDGEDDGLGAD